MQPQAGVVWYTFVKGAAGLGSGRYSEAAEEGVWMSRGVGGADPRMVVLMGVF